MRASSSHCGALKVGGSAANRIYWGAAPNPAAPAGPSSCSAGPLKRALSVPNGLKNVPLGAITADIAPSVLYFAPLGAGLQADGMAGG